jgi:hypothetical protein
MDLTTVIIAMLVVLLASAFVVRAATKRKELGSGEGDTPLPPNPDSNPDDGKTDASGPGRTLDEEYALSHSMWVCPRCETLNDNGFGTCKVCGAIR